MSKITLAPNVSGSGTFTIAAPDSSTDRTLTLPDVTTTLVGADAAQTLTNKTFSGAQTFGTASLAEPTGGAPLFMARAWVNFNGTGTVAIRGSGNVTSITDNGAGDYTVNFTTAMPDVNYVPTGIVSANVSGNRPWMLKPIDALATPQTTSYRFVVSESGITSSALDSVYVTVAFFR